MQKWRGMRKEDRLTEEIITKLQGRSREIFHSLKKEVEAMPAVVTQKRMAKNVPPEAWNDYINALVRSMFQEVDVWVIAHQFNLKYIFANRKKREQHPPPPRPFPFE